MYSEKDLLALAKAAAPKGYIWKSGKAKGKMVNDVVYLSGYKSN
jgi:hypothetical protein